MSWGQRLRRIWHWSMLGVSVLGTWFAFRLAYVFWNTADEDRSGAIWYAACVVAVVGGLFLLWQVFLSVRRLRAPP